MMSDGKSAKLVNTYDLCIVGGGINGVGIARDAAGRGLSVLLLEKDDLGQGTSSRSGKLVHGGLRYLEYFEFRLVREALIEREVLLESAPHIIWPLRFVLPHSTEDRPAWLIRLGLFLYDHLGGRKRLPSTRVLDLRHSTEGSSLKPVFRKAFEFSDCWVDDSRLVVINAIDAAEKGADIKCQTRFKGAKRIGTEWQVLLQKKGSGQTEEIRARCLVNTSGPWVNGIIDSVEGVASRRRVRLVKGSHLVVKKFWSGDNAYLIQNKDNRVIFINPYENGNALIGTTDIPFEGSPDDVKIDEVEIEYLLAAVNRYFSNTLSKADILQTFSGVRPLYDDNSSNPSAVTRDYLFDVDSVENKAPLLSVFGGKITTFRKLAEHALDKLSVNFPDMGPSWTASAALPGGDIPNADFDTFFATLCSTYSSLALSLVHHYARLYGTRANDLLENVSREADLGLRFGEHFYEKEVHYLVENEWALTANDILERRTKHGLHMSSEQVSQFVAWFEKRFNMPLIDSASNH